MTREEKTNRGQSTLSAGSPGACSVSQFDIYDLSSEMLRLDRE